MSGSTRTRIRLTAALAALAVVGAASLALGACEDGEDALLRGDRLWAEGRHRDAIAEYRLALRQSGNDAQVMRRVAHAYAETGQLDRAREYYDRLLARAPEHADQAVYDYLRLARQRLERGDRQGMGAALESALALRPGLPLPEYALPLGAFYRDTGQPERALEVYERALATSAPEATPALLFELGVLQQSRDRCVEAIGYFDAYLHGWPSGARADEARWHKGQCSFELGREARQSGQLTQARGYLDMVLELGVPENVQEPAWLELGEVLFALGEFDEALAAYRNVIDLNPARTGQWVERAQRRIDEIRFRW